MLCWNYGKTINQKQKEESRGIKVMGQNLSPVEEEYLQTIKTIESVAKKET